MHVSPIDALRAIHEELWDAERGMDRFARGVVPGVDISSLNLHSVRETALGAFLDLDHGNTDRAVTAIRNVLALQYPASDWPWSGTFPVTAEQRDPPGTDAIEWVHYDPNWRQFLGCILALTLIHHGSDLPDDIRTGIDEALSRCVHGEPDTRIAPWYTNPNLMHAWLLGHVGLAIGDADLIAAGERRVHQIMERFERFGDIDEYNSPTYDGIDLFALALWATHPPTPNYERSGAAVLTHLGARISALYHRQLGAVCGPYIRAYGLDLQRYVSLAGIWLHIVGEPTSSILPTVIDQDTVHVHDLYFLPVMLRLAPNVCDHLTLQGVTAPRHHVQRFGGACAESHLRSDVAVGWEYGRRHEASLDQYVPFTAHFATDSQTSSIGIMVPGETAWIDVRQVDDLSFELCAGGKAGRVGVRVVVGSTATVAADRVTFGQCDISFDLRADEVTETTTAVGLEIHMTWAAEEITGRIALRSI
ncbi:MAG TPA: hypothetical protein VES40_15035 [Ilumatobacteraceae bacterium]|nr:hypothetical protein [Ilumatobacteraceae bacterium]